MRRTLAILLLAVAPLAVAGCAGRQPPKTAPPAPDRRVPARTVADVLRQLGPAVDARLAPQFARARVAYPPREVVLVGLKRERKLEVWVGEGGRPAFLRSYPILAASGDPGPKLREGDWQVPEGVYRVTWLHPNSDYHLSLKLDYPNEFDRRMAQADGRTDLGGDIFIHGGALSIGCLAVGDAAVEDLFVLAARTGIERVKVIIAPNDLRRSPPPALADAAPRWVPQLYTRLRGELATLTVR